MSRADFVGRLGNIDSLVAFFPGIAPQHREDIQDALLYAQLRAGHAHDFQHQWSSWIHNYRLHLVSHGFQSRGVVTEDSTLISHVDDLYRARFGVPNMSMQVKRPLGDLVRGAFARLGVVESAERFFQGHHLSATRLATFQLMPCEQLDNGEIMTLLCSLQLNVDDHSAGSRRLILHFKGGAYRFEPQAFAPQREKVRRYLAGKGNAFITRIEL